MAAMFDNVNEKLSETGKAVGSKVKKFSEVTQLKYKMAAAEKERDAMFIALGKSVYEAEKENTESVYFAECADIAKKQSELDEMKLKIDAAKGVIICQSCGAECDSKNDYCGKCGTKLIKPIEPTETEEDENAGDILDEEKTEDTEE